MNEERKKRNEKRIKEVEYKITTKKMRKLEISEEMRERKKEETIL